MLSRQIFNRVGRRSNFFAVVNQAKRWNASESSGGGSKKAAPVGPGDPFAEFQKATGLDLDALRKGVDGAVQQSFDQATQGIQEALKQGNAARKVVEDQVPFAAGVRENIEKAAPNIPKLDPQHLAAFAQMNDPTQFKDFQAKAQDKVVKGAISAMIIHRLTSTGNFDKNTQQKVAELLGDPVSELITQYKDDIPKDPQIELLEKISGQLDDLNKSIKSLATNQKAAAAPKP